MGPLGSALSGPEARSPSSCGRDRPLASQQFSQLASARRIGCAAPAGWRAGSPHSVQGCRQVVERSHPPDGTPMGRRQGARCIKALGHGEKHGRSKSTVALFRDFGCESANARDAAARRYRQHHGELPRQLLTHNQPVLSCSKASRHRPRQLSQLVGQSSRQRTVWFLSCRMPEAPRKHRRVLLDVSPLLQPVAARGLRLASITAPIAGKQQAFRPGGQAGRSALPLAGRLLIKQRLARWPSAAASAAVSGRAGWGGLPSPDGRRSGSGTSGQGPVHRVDVAVPAILRCGIGSQIAADGPPSQQHC